jgi:hypothetical protein
LKQVLASGHGIIIFLRGRTLCFYYGHAGHNDGADHRFRRDAGVELVVVGADTTIGKFKQELRHNAVYYHLNRGI